MFGPYVHDIDPIIAQIGGVYLWWYGLGYSLGFLHLHLFLRRHRLRIGLTSRDVYTLSLFVVMGVLVGARLIEVAFDEWPFYQAHLALIPAYWLGGLASHGVLLGATGAVTCFALLYRKRLLVLFDAVVIPGSFLMGMGRLGNFIDGQIVGALTDLPWGVAPAGSGHWSDPEHRHGVDRGRPVNPIAPSATGSLARWHRSEGGETPLA
jgi:phosphatidylglycerol:prolipoprotein diacylglycerol transferase